MIVFDHPLLIEHITGPSHPERPARVTAIRDMLQLAGVTPRVSPFADPALLLLNHTESLVQRLAHTRERDAMRLDADTVTSKRSFDAALASVGGAIEGVRAVCAGENGALVLARPPGHHAERDQAMGFCLVNNVAIAARWAQSQGLAKRVAIVDWDVHHGNGTQHAFYDDPSVLFISLHQWPFYPGTGAADEIGDGTTLNVPLPAGSGDSTYRAAFARVIMPKLAWFKPDLILVSAGFDAHKDDPLGGMLLTRDAYGDMTQHLIDYCDKVRIPKPVLLLEGGYSLGGLADSVAACMERFERSGVIGSSGDEAFAEMRRLHRLDEDVSVHEGVSVHGDEHEQVKSSTSR